MRSIATPRAALGAVLLFSCSFAGCDSSSGADVPYSGGSSQYSYCRHYTTCGTCTPVDGCGWCFDSNGLGECVSGPDECSTQTFSWTWNTSGCRVPADAGAVPVEVGDGAAPGAPPALDAEATGDASFDAEADGGASIGSAGGVLVP